MSVTINDIARQTGFSKSTVSRALANDPHVLETTKKQIITIAKELDYKPNFNASTLVTGGSHSIGVIFPSNKRHQSNPFYLKIIAGMQEILSKEGFVITVALADTTEEILNVVTTMSQQANIKKFIFLYYEENDLIRRYLKEKELLYVTIGNSNTENGVFIDNDNVYFGQLTLSRISESHKVKNVLFIRSNKTLLFEEERLSGVLQSVQNREDVKLVVEKLDFGNPNDLQYAFLGNFDYIIAAQDKLAEFIYQALLAQGHKVPIITFNNSVSSFNHRDYIFSFDLKPDKLGEKAVEELLKLNDSSTYEKKCVYYIR